MCLPACLPAHPLSLAPVPHLHGAHVHSASDGHPNAWFTARGARGPSFSSTTFSYANAQPPATLWYHDHTAGMTRLNVDAGLFGAYLLSDAAAEARFNLPAGRFDVPLLLQDKSFTREGALRNPRAGQNPSVHPYWVPQGTGDYATVNGKVRDGGREGGGARGGRCGCMVQAPGAEGGQCQGHCDPLNRW